MLFPDFSSPTNRAGQTYTRNARVPVLPGIRPSSYRTRYIFIQTVLSPSYNADTGETPAELLQRAFLQLQCAAGQAEELDYAHSYVFRAGPEG